jgi:hypothetical protein
MSRRGNYAILVVVCLPVILGFMALAIDLSYQQIASNQAQQVADTTAHSAYIMFRNSRATDSAAAESAASDMVALHKVGDGPATLDTVEIGSWDFDENTFSASEGWNNAVKVELSRAGDNPLNLFIAPVVGIESPNIYQEAVVARQNREWMVVQDITGSFSDDIDAARDASLNLLAVMLESKTPSDKVGMSVFTGGVDPVPWSPLVPVLGNEVDLLSQWASLDSCNCTDSAFEEADCAETFDGESEGYEEGECAEWFCEEYYGGYDTQPWMPDCFELGTQSAPGAAILQATEELIVRGDPRSYRGILVVTDGLPCCGLETIERAAEAYASVDYAAANGLHVWTAAYSEAGEGDPVLLGELVRGKGSSFVATDGLALAEAMVHIVDSVPVMVVN